MPMTMPATAPLEIELFDEGLPGDPVAVLLPVRVTDPWVRDPRVEARDADDAEAVDIDDRRLTISTSVDCHST